MVDKGYDDDDDDVYDDDDDDFNHKARSPKR